jgi:ribosomal protein L11 methyltransferase
MNYLEFNFDISPFKPWSEILTAYLSDIDFDGFHHENETLKAFVAEDSFKAIEFEDIIDGIAKADVTISYTRCKIPQQNWNKQWESNFDPVAVNDELLIIAPFHKKNDAFNLNIVIQPKMSFGTGHHQTTHLMCEAILKLDLKEHHILDMGSGTGVLAILAEKKGAKNITAIDIEDWSVESCIENSVLNDCKHVDSLCGGIELIDGKKFDVIFANINKNILKDQMNAYYEALNKNGFLYLSGFFETDVDELISFAKREGFFSRTSHVKEEWAMLVFQK